MLFFLKSIEISTLPKAYLNYLFFDEEMNLRPQESEALQVASSNIWEDLIIPKFTIQENGYVYIYSSNISELTVRTDNLKVLHYQGQLLEEFHYYPYGLTFEVTRAPSLAKGSTQRYNEQFIEREEFVDASGDMYGLEWYDFAFRSYDVQIGRWMQPDPMMQHASPYLAMADNPVSFVDPDGLLADPVLNSRGEIVYDDGENNGKYYLLDQLIGDAHGNISILKVHEINRKEFDNLRFEYLKRQFFEDFYKRVIGQNGQMKAEGEAYGSGAKYYKYNAIMTQIIMQNSGRNNEMVKLASGFVKVSFDKGANNEISPKLANYFSNIMEQASKKGIYSVNISSTTNHPSNSKKSAHSLANGARAFDLNYINGMHVSTKNLNVIILQKIIQTTPGWRENYGPSIIEKMNNGAAIRAPWARDIPGGHYDHIHVSVPR